MILDKSIKMCYNIDDGKRSLFMVIERAHLLTEPPDERGVVSVKVAMISQRPP